MITVVGSLLPEELPEDQRAFAKGIADRKVMRFLDMVSLPAFVASCVLLDVAGEAPANRKGLFTISAWEADVTASAELAAGGAERLVKHYLEESNPTDWLRAMPNNALCQVAIVTGLRGPNAHFVGGGAVTMHALTIAMQALDDGAADLAVVVAFDQLGTADEPASAAGVVLGTGGGAALSIEDAAAARDMTALDAMVATVRALREVGTGSPKAVVASGARVAARAVACVDA